MKTAIYSIKTAILVMKTYPTIPACQDRNLIIRTSMKNLLFIFFVLGFLGTSAQDVIRQRNCSNQTIASQVDSLKKTFEQNGFMVVKEASMSMESEYEMPVIVPLNQGSWYHIIFLGEPSSRLHEVRMYDYDEKQVYYKKIFGYSEGNIISYMFMPKFSEWHMIKPVQVNKAKKSCCGYIMLLKKVKVANDTSPIPSR